MIPLIENSYGTIVPRKFAELSGIRWDYTLRKFPSNSFCYQWRFEWIVLISISEVAR